MLARDCALGGVIASLDLGGMQANSELIVSSMILFETFPADVSMANSTI